MRALNRTRRGDLDVSPPGVLEAHYPDQVEPATLHGAVTLYRLTPERSSFLVANHRRFPLGDPQFRRALAMLWDRPRFAHELHKDLASPSGGPSFGAEPALAFDRRRAVALLEDAGYRDNDADGVRDRAGRPSACRCCRPPAADRWPWRRTPSPWSCARQASCSTSRPPTRSPSWSRLKKGDFDLAPMVWEGHPDEDPTPLFGAEGLYNFGGYRSTAVEAVLDELRHAAGPPARQPILARLARLIAEEQPMIFLYRHDVPALISNPGSRSDRCR